MEMLKKYIDQIKEDLTIDEFNLKEVQMRLPARKHFWVARLMDAKIARQKLLARKKSIKREITDRVINESVIKLQPQSVDQIAENTPDIEKINEKLKELDFTIEYLEKAEKIFSTIHWEIKNIIQIQQLEQL
jgi:hypothetical protein